MLGQALEAQNKLDEAAEQYRKMLAVAPAARAAEAHYSLGVVLYKGGKYDEAAKELAAVVTDSPDSPYAKPAKLQLGLVQLAGGKTAEARQTLTAVGQVRPGRRPRRPLRPGQLRHRRQEVRLGQGDPGRVAEARPPRRPTSSRSRWTTRSACWS